MPVNVLVVGLSEKCVNIVLEESVSVHELKGAISERQNVSTSNFFLARDGSPLDDCESVWSEEEGGVVIVRAYPAIRGGKGGFGTLIRSMGMQINKSASRGACRDLTGRRMRDVDAEKKIAKWVKSEPERKRKREQEKRRKRERILSRPKHYFNDPEYMEQKRSNEESMDDALRQGMEASGQPSKRKAADQPGPSKKRKLWLGVDEAELSSEEEEEEEASGSPDEASSSTSSSSPPPDSTGDDHSAGSSPSQKIARVLDDTASPQDNETPSTAIEPEVNSNADSAVPTERKETTEHEEAACIEPVDLEAYGSAAELEAAGLERIKASLQALGLKCGGTLSERAARLYSTKGRSLAELDHALFAKAGRRGKGKKKQKNAL